MSRAKKIAAWSFGILLLVLSAPAIFLAFAGDDFYRWALDEIVEGAIDRQVTVDGSFSFDLGWEPTLIATDVWVGNADWTGKKEMARVERLEVQVALRPLFLGILLVPRLVVQGLTLELEESPEGKRNWTIAAAVEERDRPAQPEQAFYPLLDFVSLSDITIVYRDRGSGRELNLQLAALNTVARRGRDLPYEIRGLGALNERPFTIGGQLGSIEDAMAATTPFPFSLNFAATNLTAEASGTVANPSRLEGLDISLLARTPSIYEVMRTFQIEGDAFGPAVASARLQGDAIALAAEEIALSIVAPSGQELKAEGRIANLSAGEGLDLQFGGMLDPKSLELAGDLPPNVTGVLDGLTDLDVQGRLTGNFEQPVLQDLNLSLEHVAGAEVSLAGRVTADLSGEDPALTGFEATTQLFLADEELLAEALYDKTPAMSDLEATAELAWSGDVVTVSSLAVTGKALDDIEASGSGQLGRLDGSDFAFDVDVQLDLAAKSGRSLPLFYLIEGFSPSNWKLPEAAVVAETPPPLGQDLIRQIQLALTDKGYDPGAADGLMGPRTRGAIEAYQQDQGLAVDGRATLTLLDHLLDRPKGEPAPEVKPVFEFRDDLPELGPVDASIRFLFANDLFRFEDLDLRYGTDDSQYTLTGLLGTMEDGPERVLREIDLVAGFSIATSLQHAEQLPPEMPEFNRITGGFRVTGTEDLLVISEPAASAEGPFALRAAVTGGVAEIDFEKEPEIRRLALDVEAQFPDSQSVYAFVTQELPDIKLPDIELPELGAVRVQARLRDNGDAFALEEIDTTVGEPERPAMRVTGTFGDLAGLAEVAITGEFEIATTQLIEGRSEPADRELGIVRGGFELSDADGSLGLEVLSAKVDNASLLTLSVEGIFDDIEDGDDLRLAASFQVPDLTRLGRKLGFDAEPIGRVTFDGELAGSDELFRAKGEATLGETDITGKASGTLLGERPQLKAEIYSPLFRLADIGFVPEETEEAADQVPDAVAFEASARRSEPELIFDEEPIDFDALRDFDLGLDIVLEDVEGVRLDVDKIEARVDLVDGELKIDPLSFSFVGGRSEMRLLADARPDPPQVKLSMSADDVDLEAFLAQARVEVPLDGTMDFLLDLKAQGRSPRDLAASLSGETDLSIADGHVLTGLLDLTTTNPVSWMFTKSARKGYSSMNCLIVRFDIEEGLATSETLLLDTENILAQGSGQIDFRNETLKIDIDPRAKRQRLIAFSTPFSIKGPLAEPEVDFSTASVSLRTGGEVLLSPINLLGSLLPFARSKGGDNACLTLKAVPATE